MSSTAVEQLQIKLRWHTSVKLAVGDYKLKEVRMQR